MQPPSSFDPATASTRYRRSRACVHGILARLARRTSIGDASVPVVRQPRPRWSECTEDPPARSSTSARR